MASASLPGPNVTQQDRDIFELHNKLRTNPKMLIPDLQEMLGQFDDYLLKRPGKVTLKTKEGADAVNDAIKFL